MHSPSTHSQERRNTWKLKITFDWDGQQLLAIHLYACLADKFNIPINTDYIVYHAWYTADGTGLKDYTMGSSKKTCPGTNFWNMGNTVESAKKRFLVDVQFEYNRLKGTVKEEDEPMTNEEKQAFKGLQEEVSKLKKRLNMEAISSKDNTEIEKFT